jgi:uncharacterized membrane protein
LDLGAFDKGYEQGQYRSFVVPILINFSDNEIGAILTTTGEKKTKVRIEGCEALELFLPKSLFLSI